MKLRWLPELKLELRGTGGLQSQVESVWRAVGQGELEDKAAVVLLAAGKWQAVATAPLGKAGAAGLEQAQVVQEWRHHLQPPQPGRRRLHAKAQPVHLAGVTGVERAVQRRETWRGSGRTDAGDGFNAIGVNQHRQIVHGNWLGSGSEGQTQSQQQHKRTHPRQRGSQKTERTHR